MLNNYLHDFAAAVFLVSAILLFRFGALAIRQEANAPGAALFFLRAYEKLKFLLFASVVWIAAGGVVRTLAYKRYEWMPAAGRGQIPALVLKHVLIFAAVALGVWFWLKLKKVVVRLQECAGAGRTTGINQE